MRRPRPLFLFLVVMIVGLGPVDSSGRTNPNPPGRIVRDPLATRPAHPDRVRPVTSVAKAAPVSLPAGAVLLDETYYDLPDFGSLGKRIFVASDGTVHVTYQDDLCELAAGGCPPDLNDPQPFPERSNAYRFRDSGGVWSDVAKASDPSVRGCCVTELFGGYGAMTLLPDGRVAIAPHLNEDGCDARATMYVQTTQGGSTFDAYLSPISDPSFLFPQVVALPDGSFTMLGEIAEFGTYNETDEFRITRVDAEGPSFSCPVGWQFGPWTPVVSNLSVFRDGAPAFPAMAAGSDGRVGIAVGDFGGNVFLYESSDGSFGGGTVTVTQITSYTDAAITAPDASSDQYRSFVHCDLVYNGTEPNVVWAELQGRRSGGSVFFVDHRSRIMHWNPTDGISTVYQTAGEADTYGNVDTGGTGPLAGFNTISVDWPQVGFSDNGLETYVVWVRFVDSEVDPTADAGLPGIVTGIGYGDIAYSRRDGAGWTAPSNLTATPNADERFVSLAPSNPDNKLHLVFQASATDEAGVVTIGDRGFTNDLYVRRVAYLETPSGVGTSAPGVSTTPGRLSVSPNPSSGLVSFRLAGDVGSDQELRIYSLAGRRVASFRIDTDAVRWDGIGPGGAPVASGVYFAKLIGSAGPVTRFVIQR